MNGLPYTIIDFLSEKLPQLYQIASERAGDDQANGTVSGLVDVSATKCPVLDAFITENIRFSLDHVRDKVIREYGYPPEVVTNQFLSDHLPWVADKIVETEYTYKMYYRTVYNYLVGGSRPFYVLDDLADLLSVTDVTASIDGFELPFNGCMLIFSSDHIRKLFSQVSGTEVSGNNTVCTVVSRGTRVNPVDKKEVEVLLLFSFCVTRGHVHAAMKRELLLRPGGTIEDAIRTNWDDIYGVKFEVSTLSSDSDARFYTEGYDFFRAVLNALLFITDPQAVKEHLDSPVPELEATLEKTKKVAKKKELRSHIKRISRLAYIRLSGDFGAAANVLDYIRGGAKKWQLTHRFLVRGHQRNQPWGPGRKLRRTIWIWPFLKGPSDGPLNNKPYLVDR